MQGIDLSVGVYARQIQQLLEALPDHKDLLLDLVLGQHSNDQASSDLGYSASELAVSLQRYCGWSLLLCNAGQAL